MKQLGLLLSLLIIYGLTLPIHGKMDRTPDLPSLGDSTSGIISSKQEYELGRTYLKVIRSRTPTISDAELIDYLERLIFRLSEYSELTDHRLAILLIKDVSINAFAAPGGIVGVNAGLFIIAETESQFAAVIAHELAHLSQRHYARNVEESRSKNISTTAAIIASILILAAGGANAGVAALSSTIAGIQSSRLLFSRQFEREADNIGIKTLAHAGFDPHAMPEIFNQMDKSNRYNSKPPEFLSTHPVTKNRIADSTARAEQIGHAGSKDSKNYQLMRIRMIVFSSSNIYQLAKQLTNDFNTNNTFYHDATSYGIALAATKIRDYNTAEMHLSMLLKKDPKNINYIIAKANMDALSGKTDIALKQINTSLNIYPNYYPLLMIKAKTLSQQKEYKKAADTLLTLSHIRPEDPNIWYELAEYQGQANDILGLHQSRAEFFFLTGGIDDAIKHIKYAQKLTGTNYTLKEKLRRKLVNMHEYQKKINK